MKSTVLEDIRAIDLAIAPIFIQSLISRDLFHTALDMTLPTALSLPFWQHHRS